MFLSGSKITDAIEKVVRQNSGPKPVRVAVAFWGLGAEKRLPGASIVVCDLDSGACNPEPIDSLRMRGDCKVFKRPALHAKVVIGSKGAVISSANMSANGLGTSRSEPGTLEAGYFVRAGCAAYKQAELWFDEIQSLASEVTAIDIALARQRWNTRPKNAAASGGDPDVEPSTLLRPRIDNDHRIRGVTEKVLSFAKSKYPQQPAGHLGKIAAWAVHFLLNRTEKVMSFRGTRDEPGGLATDEWIVSRLGRGDASLVEGFLLAITQAHEVFDSDVCYAAQLVLNAKPWR